MNHSDLRRDPSRLIALVGALLAGPAFVINYIIQGGFLPEDVNRTDALLSVVFATGTSLVILSLITARVSPVGRRGRRLLHVDLAMAFGAIVWAAWYAIDPNVSDTNPLIIITDSCWPLHQVFMIVIGIAAKKHASWPTVQRRLIFAPAVSTILAISSMVTGIDLIAAILLGAGWLVLGLSIAAGDAFFGKRQDAPLAQPA